MRRADHVKQIKLWAEKYGKPVLSVGNYTFGKVTCSKCGRGGEGIEIQRHHKGCDYIFATAMPDVFAARYIAFLSDDIDYLCKRDHNRFHEWIKPERNRLLTEIDYRRLRGVLDIDWMKSRHKKMVDLYNVWLTAPVVKRTKKEKQNKKVKRKRGRSNFNNKR